MDQTSASKSRVGRGQYDINYGNFHVSLYEEIRRDAFGEDIGQNSWLTADEQDRFLQYLNLAPGKRVLDVACGAGGPVLRISSRTGCSVTGIDIHEQAISAANVLAQERGLTHLADFRVVDASSPAPFADNSFDAITCIDAINHFVDRARLLSEWLRVLKPGGRLLYTDPIMVTGPLTKAEIAERSSIGFYLFVPKGYNEQVIQQCGLHLVASKDVTHNMADIAERRRLAREKREVALREVEGSEPYEAQQRFLSVTSATARERRLSRFVFVAEK